MAKLSIAARSQAAECDPWSILRRWLKFHLVITFRYRVTAIVIKVVFVTPLKFELSKMDVKNEQRSAIKFCHWLKKSAVETVKLVHKAILTVKLNSRSDWDTPLLRDLARVFRWRHSHGIFKLQRLSNSATLKPCKTASQSHSRIVSQSLVWTAHSQDFCEFDFIDLLSIFNSRDHPLGVAVCQC